MNLGQLQMQGVSVIRRVGQKLDVTADERCVRNHTCRSINFSATARFDLIRCVGKYICAQLQMQGVTVIKRVGK